MSPGAGAAGEQKEGWGAQFYSKLQPPSLNSDILISGALSPHVPFLPLPLAPLPG